MKTSVLFTLSLLLTIMLFSTQARADDPMVVGKAALAKGDFIGAISAFREAIDKNSKNVEAFVLLGTALIKADSVDQAVAVLVQGKDLDTSNAQFYALLGDAYAKQKIYPAAVDMYQRATQMDGKNISVYLKLGESARKARKYPDAVAAFDHALLLDSMNVVALAGSGNIYMRAKHFATAVPLFERLYSVQKDSINVEVNLAKAYFETRNYQKFIPVGEDISNKDASQTEIQQMLAEAYSKTGQTDLTREKYSKLKVESLSIDDLLRYAKALKAEDSIAHALEIFERAYEKDSTRCDIPYDYGTTFMRAKRYAEAVAMFERKITCDTSSGYRFASNLNAAGCLMQLKQFTSAKEHARKSIEYRPDNVYAYRTLAEAYAQLDASEDEIAAYKKLIDLVNAESENGDVTKYNDAVGEAYKMIGIRYLIDKKYAEAADYLKKAVPFEPRNCQLLMWTGQAYQNSNRKEDAKKYYCKLIETCPKSKEAEDAQKYLDILGLKCGE